MTKPATVSSASVLRHRRWRRRAGLVLGFLGVLLAVFFFSQRARVDQAWLAWEIRQAGIFTQPPAVADESAWQRLQGEVYFYWDLTGFRLARDQRIAEFNPQIKPLLAEINRHQSMGEPMAYSQNIYRELRWYLNFTRDRAAIADRLADLRQSLDQADFQASATNQQPADGSWGLGCKLWYLRLCYSVDHLQDRPAGQPPEFPLRFLDAINSPEKLTARLEANLHNDFLRSGQFNREEMDETISGVARLLWRPEALPYSFHPGLKPALLDFINRWQIPETGCWGQWLIDRRGRTWKMDDAGITLHVVADLQGQVAHLDRIAVRLLELAPLDYPAGLRVAGHYENHLNWDAVKIFRYAWPVLDAPARTRVRTEIGAMLDWCLHQSLQRDGTFAPSESDDTVADACFFGDRFLDETGFYDPTKRFWTDREFPIGPAVQERVKEKLKQLGRE